MGRGSSERCLKWDGEGGVSLRDLIKNISKQGVGKAKVVRKGDVLKVLLPLPPSPENFNHTL